MNEDGSVDIRAVVEIPQGTRTYLLTINDTVL